MPEFSPEMLEKMKRYEEAKIMEKQAKAVIDELKDEIAAAIPEGSEVESERGKFYLQVKEKFIYSEATTEKEKSLKEDQKREKADGTATSEKQYVLMFKQKEVETSADAE